MDDSSQERQFIPQDDDDEKSVCLFVVLCFSAMISQLYRSRLWEVIEITAEYGNKYKVKWAGVDPLTGKPWEQSWVPKHDCTHNLVTGWEMKKQKSKEMKAQRRSLFLLLNNVMLLNGLT
jgi:hypothetical protein